MIKTKTFKERGVKYKYAVFDWDGTLADTYPVILGAYKYVFEQLGMKKIPDSELKATLSTIQNKDALKHFFAENASLAAVYFYEYIEKFHTQKLRPLSGAHKLLDFCRNSGIKTYLITNKKTKFIHAELEALNFKGYFKNVVAAGEYEEDKPHPKACRAVFDNQLPKPSEIIVIGDGEADVKTACALNGADSIIIDPKGSYRGAKPTYKINRLEDVKTILEKN
ncbi:MAG: HAD-IA family hydrolase [Alphaproteobacteria bacterium]|nr:HAD-IA family hydrolase [Alphaproteobacteria bacterium]